MNETTSEFICFILFTLISGIGIYGIILSIDNEAVNDEKPETRTIYNHFMEIVNYKKSTGIKAETEKIINHNENGMKKHDNEVKKDTFKIYSVIIVSCGYLMMILIISLLTYLYFKKYDIIRQRRI